MGAANGRNGHGDVGSGPVARLRELRLQGYKSFASAVTLALDAGITAIVGPNGSGKSNIADAIRWVLGEQSYQQLRGKRTEDMIFGGTEQRARVGMAEAQLVFDNASGWLPVAFQEVTIARRAYRSGENDYLQNGVRVRLRDVMELLGSAGLGRHSYTIIGQGLIDQALFVSAEERSRLIEDAAGIGVYQEKRSQALARLADTDTNRERILDLLAETEPRLRSLAAQARRADEARRIQAELRQLLAIRFGHQWRAAVQALAAAEEQENEARRQTAESEERIRQLSAAHARLATQRDTLGAAIRQAQHETAQRQAQLSALQGEIALRKERGRHLGQRLADFRAAAARHSEQWDALQQDIARTAQQLAQVEGQLDAARARLTETEASRARQKLVQQQALADAEAARQRALLARNVLNDTQRRLKQAAAQQDEWRRKQEAAAETAAQAAAEVEAQRRAIQHAADALSEAESQGAAAEAQRAAAAQAMTAAEAAWQARQDDARELQHEARRLAERHQMLNRLREEGAGYGAAVRAVLAAAQPASRGRDGERLSGIIGTVGSALQVPSRLETAIEVALGGRLQNVVVETWQDAERAIALLKRTRVGRATFLPLDTVRVPTPLPTPKEAGVLGRASDMVETSPRLRPIADALLNRTLIAQDLPTAQRIFRRVADSGGTIVTLEGEQVRAGGSISGGSQADGRDNALLGREREWRELPERIERAQQALRAAQDAVAQAETAARQARDTVSASDAALKQTGQRLVQLQRQHADAQRAHDRAAQALEWSQRLLAQADEAWQTTTTECDQLTGELARLEEAAQAADAQATQAVAAARAADDDVWLRQVAEAQAALAALQAAHHARAATLKTLRGQEARFQHDAAAAQQQAQGIEQEMAAEAAWLADAENRQQALLIALQEEQAALVPRQTALAEVDTAWRQHDEALQALRDWLHLAQARVNERLLLRQRAEDQLARLRADIVRDLAGGDGQAADGHSDAPDALIASLPAVDALPPGLEADIAQLQARWRRVGPVNPDALSEHAEAQARHDFLAQQSADLLKGADNLRLLVAEMDEIIERTFRATFQQVAARFAGNFEHLFGGGRARLELRADDTAQRHGVEITARLPGKRPQPLGLLSGGERALTAVALLFSILEVSPTPFCVLDEVDAMLDEANVGRFRDMLRQLSQTTQFIVVSHNRVTIEAADAVYGVSMGSDGASRLVSVRPAALARA